MSESKQAGVNETLDAMASARCSAILRTSQADAAAPAMEAAVRGGFRIIEFTLTTPGACDHIRAFAAREGLVVGAGTVMTLDEAERAVEAGARFLVSPVFDPEVVQAAVRLGVVAMPGCHTPTEMWQAHRAGAHLCKLFPCPGGVSATSAQGDPGGASGGPAWIRSVLGPMPFLRIVPTNGVTPENAAAFLEAGAFGVGFTTALFDAGELAARRFDAIEGRARAIVEAIPTHPSSAPSAVNT